MKQKMKKVLSLVLSVVLVMTGLTITPATRTEVQAASTDSVFITDKIVPEGETSEDFSKMLYWKGQEIELSVAVYDTYKNEIQWTTSDAKISLVGESDTSTPYIKETARGFVVKQKFKIADDAQGKYTITAKNGDSSMSFDFTVQESYMTPITSTKFSNFDNSVRWTKDQIDLYVVTKAGVEVGFTSDNPLVTIEKEDTCDSSKMFYFGKGSEVHKVTAVVGDTVNTDSQIDTATITANITSIGFDGAKKETVSMTIGQSASHVVDSSITVSCDDEAHGIHDTITHINADKNTIYLDAMFFGKEEKDLPKEKDYDGDGNLDTKKVFATITFQVEGSEVDQVIVSDDSAGYFTIDSISEGKLVGDNVKEYQLVITDLKKTAKDKPATVNLVSYSTHMVTKTLNFVIYAGGKIADFELYNKGKKIETDGLTMDGGTTGKFSIKANDDKEKVVWSVSNAEGVLSIDPDTGAYEAIGSSSGIADVTATIQDTNSGPRGMKKTFSVIVKKQVAPDKIEILDVDKKTAVSTTLYVGDNATTFYRQATKNGSTDGIYYSAYQNVLTDEKIVKVGDCNTDGAFSVTPLAKGITTFYIKADGGNVNSQPIDFKVIAPIKTITIKKDNEAVKTISAVESRELVLTAERDKEASDDEKIKWTVKGDGVVKFLDDEDKECDTYIGDTCRLVTKSKGPVTITAEATGLANRSKASTSIDLTISERVPADSVSFFADGAEIQESITKDTPYEIVSNQSKTFSIKGFSSEGRSSNDEFTGIYEVTVTGTTAKWVDDKGGFEVKAGTTPGVVELTFKNQQTDVTYKFYVKVVVPANSIQIVGGDNKPITTGLVLQEGDEYTLGLIKTPANTTDSISWYSSDSSVVSVTGQGDLKVLKYSQNPVTITAKADSGVESTCQVYVVKPIKNIEISAKDAEGNALALDGTDVVYLDNEITATATTLPEDATDIYNWTTSNASVASITTKEDGSCVIVGKAQGTVTISAIPRLMETGSDVAKAFVITVAKKPNSLDVKAANNATAESVVTKGIDLATNEMTLYAFLNPEDSYDIVSWSAQPADALELTSTNNGKNHSCKIKKLQVGKEVMLTVSTSNGIEKTIRVSTGISLSDCEVSPIANKPYDGSVYNPVITIKNADGEVLTEGTDYTITKPRDMTGAGKKEITITGKKLYCDTITVTCEIIPQSIKDGTVIINNDKNYTYTGEAITVVPGRGISVSVPMGTTTKSLSATDYDVTCTNNINAGTATATITGKGNYTGTITKTFQIDGKDLSRLTATLDATNVEYTGQAICPAVVVKDGQNELKAGVDYTVTYSNNVDVSSSTQRPTVTITGKGNYAGEKTTNFTINAQTLTDDCVTLSKTDYTYSGKNCKPKVTVRNSNGVKLKADVDYTITYPTDMTNIGIKKIVITGKGNYKGTANAEYGVAEKVSVKKASIKKAKNSSKKAVKLEIKKVSGADGYEISYSTSKKFTKDTTKVVESKKTKKTIKKLTKGKTYYFKVRAYKVNSIGRKIYGKASSVKKVKIKK